jgi:TolC family type I secretion outer membrane protein
MDETLPYSRARRGRGLRSAGAVALLLLPLGLAPASAQTLTEALSAAYNNNPTLLAERARLRATDENVPQALSNWRPTVQFTGQAGLARFEESTLSSVQRPRSVDLTIAQPLYRGGRTVAQTSQAENLVRAERAQAMAIEQQVFSDSVTVYMDLVRDQALLELAINNEQVLRTQLEAARDRFNVGEVTRTDVAQAESSYATAQATRIQAQGSLETSRANYIRVIGEPPGRLSMPAERVVLPKRQDDAIALASADNPNVVAAQFNEAAGRDNVAVIRGQLLPSVNLVGDLNRSVDQSIVRRGISSDSASLTARVTIPLYESGAIYSQTRQAMETVTQLRSQVDDSRRQVVAAATQAYQAIVAGRAQVEAFRVAIRSAEIALEGVQQEAQVGSRTVLDTLVAEQVLFNARVNLVSAQHDEYVNEFALVAAIGRLNAVDLRLPVSLYSFDTHYASVRDKWFGFESAK